MAIIIIGVAANDQTADPVTRLAGQPKRIAVIA
jgi:hypothetical protein